MIKFRHKPDIVKNQRGKVFFSTASISQILNNIRFNKPEIYKASKQNIQNEQWLQEYKLKERPFDTNGLLTLYESNVTMSACIDQIATDVAGTGGKLQLKDGLKENTAKYQVAQNFIENPNSKGISLREICQNTIKDWCLLGEYNIEVVRNAAGNIAEIYYLPGYNLKVHESGNKYCQINGTKKTWFTKYEKDYSKVANIDPTTGNEADLSLEDRANEIIRHVRLNPRNQYYGLPQSLQIVAEVVMQIGIRDFNLAFFENYGVPAYFVTLEGDWEEDSAKIIKNFLDTEIKGSENQHKTLIMQVPIEVINGEQVRGKVTFEKVSVDTKEGSFKTYHQLLREDILAAFKMPPYRIGISVIGNLGGSNIIESGIIYNNGVVEPLQSDLEYIINNLILQNGLNVHGYEYKFNDIDIRNEIQDTEMYKQLFAMGAITPNQIIQKMRIGDPYPGGDMYYIPNNIIELGENEPEAVIDNE